MNIRSEHVKSVVVDLIILIFINLGRHLMPHPVQVPDILSLLVLLLVILHQIVVGCVLVLSFDVRNMLFGLPFIFWVFFIILVYCSAVILRRTILLWRVVLTLHFNDLILGLWNGFGSWPFRERHLLVILLVFELRRLGLGVV